MAVGKGLKQRETAEGGVSRMSPDEILRATAEAGGPRVPPTQMPIAAPATNELSAKESTGAFAFRMRHATLTSLASMAETKGLTQKQIVCLGLMKMGVDVAPVDLEDRTPRRKIR